MVYVTDMRAILGGSSMAGSDANGQPLTNKPVFLTYSFETDTSALNVQRNGQAFVDSFQALSAADRANARAAFAQWDEASGITFLEVPAGMGDIKLAVFDFDTGGPWTSQQAAAYGGGGIVFVSDRTGVGSVQLYLHEIGHNLGFKHTFEGQYTLAPADDNFATSIMSYTSGGFRGNTLGRIDKEAVVHLYGTAASDGTQVASWSWDAATYTLTQAGFETADVIRGTDANDVIDGRGGNDRIDAGSGVNLLTGGAGNDSITATVNARSRTEATGDAGDDAFTLMFEEAGPFRVDGGAGNDSLYVYAWDFTGAQLSLAAAGVAVLNIERVSYGLAQDRAWDVIGAAGRDEIFLGKLNDVADGGAGDDYISGGEGDDRLTGGAGADTVYGGLGNDVLRGGADNDYLVGDSGLDQLFGEAGNDTLVLKVTGALGGYVVDGGDGQDSATVTFDDASARVLALSALGVRNVETLSVNGGGGADVLVNDLTAMAVNLDGGAGNDVLRIGAGNGGVRGGDGDDLIYAGSAFTFLYGGAGADRFVFEGAATSTSQAQDQIEDFQSGTDTIDLSVFDSVGLTVTTNAASNWISGNVGGTNFSLFVRTALTVNDVIRGLSGTGAGETLTGSAGRDVLRGLGGDDVLVGAGGADTLIGGLGADTFRGTRAELAGDLLADFTFGERIVVTDAAATLGYRQVGTRLILDGGATLTLGYGSDLRVGSRAAVNGGVELYAARRVAEHDFDGDGRSDILWRHGNGALATWSSTGTGWNSATGVAETVSADWRMAATGDINGDGVSDILWRNDNGFVTGWYGTARGFDGATGISHLAGADWKIAALEDITGDGRDDILWRNDNGAVTMWRANDTGFDGSGGFSLAVDVAWQIAGVADLNGDQKADVLWRNANGATTTWLGTGEAFLPVAATWAVGADWQVAGTGDFNGDTLADVLWRSDTGVVTQWLSTGDGFAPATWALPVGADWAVEGTGDYNGDGRADILWRNAAGDVTTWTAAGESFDGSGGVVAAGAAWGIYV